MTCSTYSGIAVGGGGDPLPRERRDGRALEQRLDQVLGVGGRQRLEEEGRRVRLAAAPADAEVEELGPRHREQEQRDAVDPLGQVLDEVEERGLRPLQVVEHDDDGTIRRESLEEAADRPEAAPRPVPVRWRSRAARRVAQGSVSASSTPARRSRSRSMTTDGLGRLVEPDRRAKERRPPGTR